MDQVLQLINSVPGSEWSAAGAWLAAGGGISVLLQLIKHFKGIDSAKVARTLLVFLSAMTGLAGYILNTPDLNLIPAVAQYTTILVAIAHFWYWLTVSPLYKWLTQLLTDAESFRAVSAPQPTSVAEPPKQFEL